MKQHFNLIIATPGHSVMSNYFKSFIATVNELNRNNISWIFANEYSSSVNDARELTLAGTFNNSYTENRPFEGRFTYDKIMWIDSDITWKPDDLLSLYYSDKDIIAGAYLFANGEVAAYPEFLKPGLLYEQVKKMEEIIEVEATGFGFICVKQGVFESLTKPWFANATYKKHNDDGTLNYYPLMGEDLSWCYRVKQNGYKIWFNPNVKVIHNKTVPLDWNL